MLRFRLDGIFVPSVTPFTRNDNLDKQALRTCVRFWVAGGVSGLIPSGSNGEGPYLSRRALSKLASEYEYVVGIKDSAGRISRIAEVTRLVGDEISVLAGTADVTLPTLMLGGRGDTLPFRKLRHLCRFEKGGYCKKIKDKCTAQNCPQILEKE